MKVKIRTIVLATAIALGLIGPLSRGAQAESINISITPISIKTQRGSTGGQPISALAVMDQSGASDDPTAYVSFTTPRSVYNGTHTFQLPPGVASASVTSLKLVANFKGPLVATQEWTWSLYNFTTKAWTKIGSNNDVSSTTTWTLLEFPTATPTTYINATGEIRVSLRSNNATGDAKIDYEAIVFTMDASPTATMISPTATVMATSSPTATSIPPTATASPTATSIPPTATASPTATSIPPTATASPTATFSPTAVPPTMTPIWTPTATAISGSVYFVSLSGNDTNPGTQAQPWRTLQKAANTVSAGATVLVQSGTYSERVTITRSGSAGAPITFQAEGVVAMNGFTFSSADYVTVDGFDISNTSLDTTAGWGIYLKGNNNVITNNRIHDTTWGGILLFANVAYPALSSNNLVQGNQIFHVGEVGIDVRGRNNVIANNTISQVMQYPSWMINPPSWADADGIHFHGSGHILRGNHIHSILFTAPENVNPHIDCFQTFASAPSQEAASNIIIEQNRCDNAQVASTGEAGKGLMLQGASSLTIRNNLIAAYTGINANSGTSSLTIINNTFTSDVSLPTASHPVGVTLTDVSNSTIVNNIFYDMPGHVIYLTNSPGLTSGYNLAYRSDGRALWTTGTYSRTNDLWGVNPMFVSVNDFHLTSGSPAIDAGIAVAVPNDFDSLLRPQLLYYDIGAYEYQ